MASAASTLPTGLVLDLDPDLASSIDPSEREAVRQACRGELLQVPRGAWPAASEAADREDCSDATGASASAIPLSRSDHADEAGSVLYRLVARAASRLRALR